LEAVSDVEIVSAQVSFDADSLVTTLTKDAGISLNEVSTTINLNTDIPITDTRLRPFSTLTYWWDLTDADGNQYTTPLQTAIYRDNRLNWQSLTRDRDNVTVYWADGDDTLARMALEIVDEVQGEILDIMPASSPPDLQIYLYPTYSDLRATLQLAGYDWVAGQAIPELGVIAIALPDQTTATVELRRTLPHELSHLLLYQATDIYYDNAPIWFDEGLATFFESELNPNQVEVLNGAINAGKTLPLESLCLRFPTDEQSVQLAYAQSGALLTFIQQRYGNQAITQMADAVADGAGCEAMVRRVLGISTLQLEQEWLASLQEQSFWQQLLQNNGLLWLFLFGGLGLGFLLWFNPVKVA
jgi:hypothetical protein